MFGDGVNIAARLQALAEPDTICLSQKVYEEVETEARPGHSGLMGKPNLKNIAQRFRSMLFCPSRPQGYVRRCKYNA